jgi:adenylate cyclase
MFTDVKGFSTFSEKLDPNDLVKLLNRYLTIMSDLILETGGTIDKFEGDAIIAFWGAPITLVDHARRTARTAVLMKRAEKALNEELKAEGMAPMYTRIGINTGDMTVGNMGTAKRMDYTMMGNAVNLAARLEGVNKQYTTWILTSQATRDELGDEFLVRRLDRVRVVGISTPVRLYQVVDILAEADPTVKELIATFEAGLDVFEERDWVKSEKLFQDVLKINAEDGPALKYLKRAQEYQKEAPADDWDGVYSMTEK